MDPFYSPGMDWIIHDVARGQRHWGAAKRRSDEWVSREAHRDLGTSYRCWFEAVYKDKDEYKGEFDLISTALIFDLCLYYPGIASRIFRYGENALLVPLFSSIGVGPIFRFMRSYNRRFADIVCRRRKRRMLGKTTCAHRRLIAGFRIAFRQSESLCSRFR